MKIIAVSDSHGSESELISIVRKHRSAEVVIFCGDGNHDIDTVRMRFPEKMVYAVKGNCDWYCSYPNVEELDLCGKHILITHGHVFGVKNGYYTISIFGRSRKADIVVFGHTHKQVSAVDGNMLLVNPGSVADKGCYSIITIDEKSGEIRVDEYPHSEYGPVILRQQKSTH